MVGLKGERFILPSGDTLERAGLAGRARARKAAAAAIVEGLSSAELTRLDELVINNPDFGMTPLAWLRNFEEAPTAANINGLLERLRYVRGIGIHPVVGAPFRNSALPNLSARAAWHRHSCFRITASIAGGRR